MLREAKKEANRVMDIIEMSSVVPEEADLMYHVVAMDWYRRWQAYVGVKDLALNGVAEDEDDS